MNPLARILEVINPTVSQEHYQNEEEVLQEFATSARTAISRRVPSAPLKQVLTQYPNLVSGRVMHFAKGRGETDTNAIQELTEQPVLEYDYTFAPNVELLQAKYDTTICIYCLNTLPPVPRHRVWATLSNLCAKDGIVIIAVRSDKDRGIKGTPIFDGVRVQRLNTFQIGYAADQLRAESEPYFEFAQELSARGAYRLLACSHSPLPL
ncbi:hypothetical protein [Vibrio agarivorans]|uniref:SAM-dependent methyltransferase n=1 Tax=Vibrio agarivorans TaxID=153622 RepID=A0ABT7Y728_9VIBR|nr:hypothetical protein [Vibrio agarivorans]MDN2483854.1 hypothetical protein [Vibrio agarivorans]